MTGDPYWDNVAFLSGFEEATADDESSLANTVTEFGSAATTSAHAKFGTQSLSIPDDTAAISFPATASKFSGTDPFTLVLWVASAALADSFAYLAAQYDISSPTGRSWRFIHDQSIGTPADRILYFDIRDSVSGSVQTACQAAWDPTADEDYLLSVDFDGTTYRIYVNGVVGGTGTNIYSFTDSTIPVTIGSASSSGGPPSALFFAGYFDEVRFTPGVARYAGAYVPPEEAFPRGADNTREIIEGIGIWSLAGEFNPVLDSLTETVGVHLAQVWAWHGPLTDALGASYRIDAIRAQPALAEDDIGASDALVATQGVVMLERLRIALSQIPNHYFQKTLASGLGVHPAIAAGMPVTLTEGVGVAFAQVAQHAIQVLEELGLLPAIVPTLIYTKSLTDTIRLADSLARFFGADVSDGIGIEHTEVATAARLGSISEGIGVAPAITPQLIMRVTATDEISLDNVDALQMIFSPILADGIQLSAAYLSPGGSITTWAVNTRSGAVTEYDNYAFNSFARIDNSYVGASSDGLYELTGDDDDGADIVAQIKSGFAQWGGSKLMSFKGAYLGVRGSGDFVLKLITGDDKTYIYAVSARDVATTKVTLGKGLRARYWAFELISTGQDFDLDTIEFVPMVSNRRV
jgi:hypothetical protein